MDNTPFEELPIRSKREMLRDIAQIIQYLEKGDSTAANAVLHNLKTRSIFLEDPIQQDVLRFAEQIQFQATYDPNHHITIEIKKAADKLIEDLGFEPPRLP